VNKVTWYMGLILRVSCDDLNKHVVNCNRLPMSKSAPGKRSGTSSVIQEKQEGDKLDLYRNLQDKKNIVVNLLPLQIGYGVFTHN